MRKTKTSTSQPEKNTKRQIVKESGDKRKNTIQNLEIKKDTASGITKIQKGGKIHP